MTDTQLITIVISLVAVLGAMLLNSSRIVDAKELLRAEIKTLRAETDARVDRLESHMDKRFDAMDRKLDELLRIAGDHETRIGGIEQRAR